MSVTFINMAGGSKLKRFANIDIKVTPGKFGSHYNYIEFGCLPPKGEEGKNLRVLKEGESYHILVNCGNILIRDYKLMVDPHPSLISLADVQLQRIYEKGDSGPITMRIRPLKDIQVKDIGSVARVSLFA